MKVSASNANGVASTSAVFISSSTHEDPRVSAALEEYMNRRRAGEQIVRDEWLAQHAEIRDALSECLDGLELILAAGPGSREPWQEAVALAGLLPTTLLGDFRILRELGRGGMGIVYEAEQVSLGRRVALKVLPPWSSLDPRWRQRFQVEAQAAANLRHDHIVPVFAIGVERGVQYYAMPYIEGRTLAAVIHELRAAAGLETDLPVDAGKNAAGSVQTPLVGLATAEFARPDAPGRLPVPSTEAGDGPTHLSSDYFRWIARLGVQAAEALGHAHGLGIIHRDVKPSNLMVDHRGELWLTDFGLARLHDEVGLTQTGDLLGTLRYMSPEQVQARRSAVDHRTDIYSLGATLYELATLRPAFEGRDRQELLNKITLDEPAAPRRLNPSLPRDLETIILKAMAKEVSRRYVSAHELGDDLRRFLDDRSILARSPSVIDRVTKFSRRHRVALVSATVVLVAGLAVGSLLLWLEQHRTDKVVQQLQSNLVRERSHARMYSEMSDALQSALARERSHVRKYYDMSDDLTMQAMGTIASQATPDQAAAPTGFYRKALSAYEKIAADFEPVPEMREVAAQAYRKVGFVRVILRYVLKLKEFENTDAFGAYETALSLLRAASAADPGAVEPLRLLGEYGYEYAQMRTPQDRVEGIVPIYMDAMSADRRLLAEHPERTDLIEGINQRRLQLARMLSIAGRTSDYETVLRDLLHTGLNRNVARNDLAFLLAVYAGSDKQQAEEALVLARKAIELEPNNAYMLNTLALALLRVNDIEGAEAALDKAMKLHTPEGGDFVVRALIEEKKGDIPKSRAALKKSLSLKIEDPLSPTLIQECKRLLEQHGDSGKPISNYLPTPGAKK